ncbi:MAG: hypothetical protein GC161_02595 [Planctomycetaceae bacterium]|nr:hypothetical protein [Planctomycetaceae bacterium]
MAFGSQNEGPRPPKAAQGRSSAADQPPDCEQFLSCIHQFFAHDLCNPLGTIVNYAAVLEGSTHGGPRDLASRIGHSAQRASRMAQTLARAAGLAVHPPGTEATDLAELAAEVAHSLSLTCQIEQLPPGPHPPATVDPELLRAVWTAYLAAARGPDEDSDDELHLSVRADELAQRVELELWYPSPVDDRSRTSLLPVEPEDFLRSCRRPSRLEDAFALRLSACMVICRSGSLTLWGTPGSRSRISLEFPRGWGEAKLDAPGHTVGSCK